MRLLSIGFLSGILVVQQFANIPLVSWNIDWLLYTSLFALFLPLWLSVLRKYRLAIGFLSGFSYALWAGTSALETRLDPALEGENLIVSGEVASIPQQRENGWKFRLNIQRIYRPDQPSGALGVKGVLRLGWYRTQQQPQAGEQWQLLVRLKRPSGFMNPGGFDYEKWLFHERIVATGYVRDSPVNQRLAVAPWFSVNAFREKLLYALNARIRQPENAAIVSALAVAERSAISDQQWSVFRNTGTNHLIAISGLHIGMVAGFGFLPVLLLGWLFPGIYQKIPVRIAAGLLGAGFAILYAVLAGFTLPTQRALIMVLVVLGGLLLRQQYAPSRVLAVALLAVLLFDPLAVLSQGFWLSFTAVALILFTVARRLKRRRFEVVTLQWVLSLGMLPLTLALFGTGSLSSPLANLLAIPWVTLVVVPLTLLGLLSLPLAGLSTVLLNLAASSVGVLMTLLNTLSSPKAMLSLPEVPGLLLLIAFAGFLWFWLPQRFPARWLGLVLILPLLTYQPESPQQGSFRFHLLDIGQGLASVVQTRHHVLVYDAGPRAHARFDTGKLVVLPFLRSQNIHQLDTLLISHEDMDHRGGAATVLEQLPVNTILSSDTRIFPAVTECRQGMHWVWDQVQFEILGPPEGWLGNDNNRSCVLRVSNSQHSLLLTGDIQKAAENQLLRSGTRLAAEVMLIPHHGSKSSSQPRFLEAVAPTLALVSAGYRNPFRQPHADILQRYKETGIPVLSTIESGAISVYFPADKRPYQLREYRHEQRRYWHR